MKRVFAGITLGTAVLAFSARAQSIQVPPAQAGEASLPTEPTEHSAAAMPALPAIPRGKATVIGGAIHDVDPVRDQFLLKVSGGGSLKVLFDERTQVFRDGVRTPLLKLRAEDHASVETVLDGTNVFALSIHLLSQAPQGETEGQVLSFDPTTRVLALNDRLSNEPIRLVVPADTPVVDAGQAAASASADFIKGTLVAVTFHADSRGQGVANQVTILATPGSTFVFSGDVTALDFPGNRITVVDPRDNKSYSIVFEPARFAMSRDLHQGMHVRVTAAFDGSRYVATALTVQ